MKQNKLNIVQNVIPEIVQVLVVTVALCVVYGILDFVHFAMASSAKELLFAFVKSVVTPVALLIVLVSSKKFRCSRQNVLCAVCISILLSVFFLVRFSVFEPTVGLFLYIFRSCICIAFFFAAACFLAYLKRVVVKLDSACVSFLAACFAGVVIHLAIPVVNKDSVDSAISMVLLGVQPCCIALNRLIATKNRAMRKRIKTVCEESDKRVHERGLYTVLLFVSIILSSLYYFNREATDLEGIDVFSALLLNDGKMIYRDFFFYVPPLYILRQNIVWSLFDGAILPMRMVGLMERAVVLCLTFLLLSRWFKPINAYIASLLAYFAYNTNLFNSYGDYTSVCQLLLVSASYLAVKYSEELKKENIIAASWWLLGAGVLATQSVMTKHSIGIIALACLFVSLVIFCLAQGEGKRTWRWIGVVVASFVVGLLPYLLWIGANGALDEFIMQVFLGSLNSKGLVAEGTNKETSTFSRIIANVFNKQSLIMWGVLLSALFCGVLERKSFVSRKFWRVSRSVFVLMAAMYTAKRFVDAGLLGCLKAGVVFFYVNRATALPVIIVSIFLIVAILHCSVSSAKRNRSCTIALLITMLAFLSWFCSTILTHEQNVELAQAVPITRILPLVYEYAFHFTILFVVYELVNLLVWKKTLLPKESWFFIAIALANAKVSLMGGGTASFACNGALWTLPFAACFIMNHVEGGEEDKTEQDEACGMHQRTPTNYVLSFITKSALLGILCCTALISMTQHINCVYSFYGWSAMPIEDIRAYPIDIERYDGMLVSKRTKTTLEQVTKLVEENTDDGDFVWTFPATKIYNILTNRLDQPTTATTYFFDTCPDDIALSDLEILKQNLPKVIIWKEMGEDCWEFYETNYRNGAELGQREIQRWFEDIKSTEYTLIGNVYNEYVYLRNDFTPVYTYYSDDSDFVGSMDEVAGNVQRLNLDTLFEGVLGTNNYQVTKWSTVSLLIVGVLMLMLKVPFWKPTLLMILALCYFDKISMVYVFSLALVLVYVLLVEEKNTITWMECASMALIAFGASFQWADWASEIRIMLIQPLLIQLTATVFMDCIQDVGSSLVAKFARFAKYAKYVKN